jgi:sulfite exporter TauE/SafE/copper chaperone CopZ
MKKTKCYEYEVNGMHCAACELLIEDKLKEDKSVKSVSANLSTKKVKVEVDSDDSYEQIAKKLTRLVDNDGYSLIGGEGLKSKSKNWEEFFYAIPIAVIFLLIFAILQESGILSTSATNNLPQVFILGVIASLSSCMALVGGLVLALSNRYSDSSKGRNAQLSFHIGRLGGFFILGGALGLLGSLLKPSPLFTLVLTLLVSILMLVLGINQLGIFENVSRLQIRTPKIVSRRILSLQNLNGSFAALVLGAMTFFLPCGFTLAVQALALDQANVVDSAMIMFVFALGTLPVLAAISFASVRFAGHMRSGIFLKTTGIIIIAFALYNIFGTLRANGFIS